MPHQPLRLDAVDERIGAGFAAIRAELDVPDDFPAAVLAEAATGARIGVGARADHTDLPFFTIDPVGSLDLDQAMHLMRRPGGYRVHYAIADVAAFVRAGGAVDAEAHRRAVTLYLPDGKAPLHPPHLSEGIASLLPGADRPAVLWTIDVDEAGDIAAVEVNRTMVRSRHRLDYAGVQHAVTAGAANNQLRLLAEIGPLLLTAEAARGGVSLPVPEQEVDRVDGRWALQFRGGLPAERWNAQISLLTGRAAAAIMLAGGVGLLRTMPPPPDSAVQRLRRVSRALEVPWPDGVPYGEVVRGLDPAVPAHAAFLREATSLMRGAGYTAFDGAVPAAAGHSAVAAPYAHVTAPLRRLADRHATEICLALTAGRPIPDWTLADLAALPRVMEHAYQRGGEIERACVDVVEAVLLLDHVGEVYDAIVVDATPDRPGGLVQLREPAVLARCDGDGLVLGTAVKVRLTEADPARRRVRFSRV
jgi:exoribonuclease R